MYSIKITTITLPKRNPKLSPNHQIYLYRDQYTQNQAKLLFNVTKNQKKKKIENLKKEKHFLSNLNSDWKRKISPEFDKIRRKFGSFRAKLRERKKGGERKSGESKVRKLGAFLMVGMEPWSTFFKSPSESVFRFWASVFWFFFFFNDFLIFVKLSAALTSDSRKTQTVTRVYPGLGGVGPTWEDQVNKTYYIRYSGVYGPVPIFPVYLETVVYLLSWFLVNHVDLNFYPLLTTFWNNNWKLKLEFCKLEIRN